MVRTSVFVALACSLASFGFGLSRRPKCEHHPRSMVPVVVAAIDIEAGVPVTFDLISQRSMPEQYVTHGIVRPQDASYIVGHASARKIAAGEPLEWSDFPSGVVRELGDGKVGISVPLDAELTSGARVDLLRRDDGSTLVSDVRALTSGREPWLEVTPEQAALIARRPDVVAVLRRAR